MHKNTLISFMPIALFFCASLHSHHALETELEEDALHPLLLLIKDPYALYIGKLLRTMANAIDFSIFSDCCL